MASPVPVPPGADESCFSGSERAVVLTGSSIAFSTSPSSSCAPAAGLPSPVATSSTRETPTPGEEAGVGDGEAVGGLPRPPQCTRGEAGKENDAGDLEATGGLPPQRGDEGGVAAASSSVPVPPGADGPLEAGCGDEGGGVAPLEAEGVPPGLGGGEEVGVGAPSRRGGISSNRRRAAGTRSATPRDADRKSVV